VVIDVSRPEREQREHLAGTDGYFGIGLGFMMMMGFHGVRVSSIVCSFVGSLVRGFAGSWVLQSSCRPDTTPLFPPAVGKEWKDAHAPPTGKGGHGGDLLERAWNVCFTTTEEDLFGIRSGFTSWCGGGGP
jgi:hypothetical protein